MRLLRMFRKLSLLSDVVMVTAAGLRIARRSRSGSGKGNDVGELMLVTGAGYRILRRLRRARRARRLASSD